MDCFSNVYKKILEKNHSPSEIELTVNIEDIENGLIKNLSWEILRNLEN